MSVKIGSGLFTRAAPMTSKRLNNGRGEKIRTSGPCLPKTVLYQAELHPDPLLTAHSSAFGHPWSAVMLVGNKRGRTVPIICERVG
jgi:hypothetical protein